MKKRVGKLLCLLFCLLCLNFPSSVLSAPIDYRIGGIFKNRTLVLGIDGKLSHKTSLWGENNTVLKAYTEESLSFFTAGISNILEPSIDFFPLAVFGLGVGAYGNQSFANSTEITACKNSVECKGIVRWLYGKGTLQARYKDVLARAVLKKGRLSRPGTSKPFYESSTVLIAPADGTVLEDWELTAAYEHNSRWTAGLFHMRNKLSEDGSMSRMAIAFANYTPSAWSYLLGLGYFSSPVLKKSLSSYSSDIGLLILFTASYNGTFTIF